MNPADILAVVNKVDDRVSNWVNPCPSREEWEKIKSFIESLVNA